MIKQGITMKNRNWYYKGFLKQVFRNGDTKVPARSAWSVRLTEEDQAILLKIAQYYDVSKADAVRISIKQLAAELGLL